MKTITFDGKEYETYRIRHMMEAVKNDEGLIGVTSKTKEIRMFINEGIVEERKLPLFNTKFFFLTAKGRELIEIYKSLKVL